ncbi:hypothetical protein SAMN05216599_104218 [Pseudomonas cichorii]|nr:hypothetical protein SAMN05216599_104218 [Pseudomonas cichorii]
MSDGTEIFAVRFCRSGGVLTNRRNPVVKMQSHGP